MGPTGVCLVFSSDRVSKTRSVFLKKKLLVFEKDNVVRSKELQFLIKLFLSLGFLGAPSCPPPHYAYVSILLLIMHM